MSDQEPIAIVDFRPTHADELVRMWRESFEAAVGVRDTHPIEEQRRYLLGTLARQCSIRVALARIGVVGFIAASRESVTQLYVRRGYQRQGIGTLLLQWAKR